MKTIKTIITNPELAKVGQCCNVKMSTEWMEMKVVEKYVYLPAKIKKVEYINNEKIPCVTVYLRKCAKRGNYWPIDNLMILPSNIGKVNEDGTIEDYKTILFR